jgi:hypothetical protein
MARERAFAYRRCRRGTDCLYFLTLINAHVFRILVGIFLVSYAIYTLTKPGFGMVRQAASPVMG